MVVRANIQGGREAKLQYPIGGKVVEHDFYIDDCLPSADTDSDARQFITSHRLTIRLINQAEELPLLSCLIQNFGGMVLYGYVSQLSIG